MAMPPMRALEHGAEVGRGDGTAKAGTHQATHATAIPHRMEQKYHALTPTKKGA
jgi:hypothetical protein